MTKKKTKTKTMRSGLINKPYITVEGRRPPHPLITPQT